MSYNLPKICILSPSAMAGAEYMLLQFLTKLGVEQRKRFLLIFPDEGELSFKCLSINVPYKIVGFTYIKSHPIRYFAGLIKLMMIIKKNNVRLIDSNTLTPAQVAVPLALMSGIPLVVHAQDASTGRITLFFLRMMSRYQIKKFRLVAISKFIKRTYMKYGIDQKNINEIYNGMDKKLFGGTRHDAINSKKFRERYNFSPSDFLIVIIGRVTYWKRQHIIIEAAKLFKADKNIKFLIIGDNRLSTDPSYFTTLRRKSSKDNLSNVYFLGWVENIGEILSDIDIVITLSENEPFGLTVIEAMSFKKPLIGTRSGATLELIKHNYNGLLIDLDNVEQLCGAIRQLKEDRAMRIRLGENGYRLVTSTFTLENHVKEILAVYQQLGVDL